MTNVKIEVEDEDGNPIETEIDENDYNEMTRDTRYDYSVCPICKERYQHIDWNSAVHDMMCPGHPRSPYA